MAETILPSPELLRELIEYNPDTGNLTWKNRDSSLFKSKRASLMWNTRFAGREAFTAVSNNGYKFGLIFGKGYKAHRVAWAIFYGDWPVDQIDHINREKTDNRISNLRQATGSENKRNNTSYKNNKCGLKGVHWCVYQRAWVAQIGCKGKQIKLGTFKTAEDAYASYCKAANEYHGEFARTK